MKFRIVLPATATTTPLTPGRTMGTGPRGEWRNTLVPHGGSEKGTGRSTAGAALTPEHPKVVVIPISWTVGSHSGSCTKVSRQGQILPIQQAPCAGLRARDAQDWRCGSSPRKPVVAFGPSADPLSPLPEEGGLLGGGFGTGPLQASLSARETTCSCTGYLTAPALMPRHRDGEIRR